MRKDKKSFFNNSHLSKSAVNIPEFVFKSEKLKINNPKATENTFINQLYKSPLIINHLEKNESKDNSILIKNTNSAIILTNNNKVHNEKNAINSIPEASVGKISQKDSHFILKNVNVINSKNNKGML